jgi:SAM-dependent methyltransferase
LWTPETYAEFERFAGNLLAAPWRKTKQTYNPHHYTLKDKWEDPDEFDATVAFVNEQGYPATWGRPPREWTYLDVNGNYVWSMTPAGEATLMNTKPLAPHPYDEIAETYDLLYQDDESLDEDARLMEVLREADFIDGHSVLDVGCGTGLLLDYAEVPDYMGFDPSGGMITRAQTKHPSAEFKRASLRSFYDGGKRYERIVCLYGALSYTPMDEALRLPLLLAPGGRYFAMVFADGYEPHRIEDAGVHAPHYGAQALDVLQPAHSMRFGNFIIAIGS